VKRAINIGARIADHFYFSDLETGALLVKFFGFLTAEEIANNGRRQALISH
jgi:hypothetical protein